MILKLFDLMNIILSKRSINWKKTEKQQFSKQWSETTLKYNINHYIHCKKSRQYLQWKRIKLQALKCYDILIFLLLIQNGSNFSLSLTLFLVAQNIPTVQKNAKTFTLLFIT